MTVYEASHRLQIDFADVRAIIASGELPADPERLTVDVLVDWLERLPRVQPKPKRRIAKRDGSDTADVFWSHVAKAEGDGCWLWSGATRYYGYGVMLWRGKPRSAHRIAWEITHGEVLNRRSVIMHRCDQPACCRPDHLRKGTQRENVHDMHRKGRRVVRNHNSHNRVLTESIVREARTRAAAGESVMSLAKAFAVPYPALVAAVSGRSWKSLV